LQVHKVKGYTLIELLVTVSILILVTGSSMAAYLTFSENRNLVIDANNLNALINKVRSKAVFLEYPNGCNGLIGYNLKSEYNSGGQNTIIKYYAHCSSGDSTPIFNEVLKSSILIQDINLTFLPGNGNLSSSADTEIVLQSTKGANKTKKIIINQFLGSNNVINKEE